MDGITRSISRLAVVAAFGLATACGGNLLGPDNQPQISNQTDTFQWQVTAMDNISQTLTYTWQNTGTSANVNQSPNLSGGSATLTILDASDVEVYSRSLAQGGTFQTSAGATGAWTIEVRLSGAGGALNFRVEKP
jgi:hypothetical protein